jgi:predicted small metal-binding protein
MRVVECNLCGDVVSAATEEELVGELIRHHESQHPSAGMTEERARELVSAESYEASDS